MSLPNSSSQPKRRRGIALILVLAALLMIGAIVLSFLSSVTNDARSSSVFSEDARAKQLSETVTNLVMGQIIEATKGFKTGGNTDANRLAWASQPGAIRTYDASGNAFQVFKLYSSATMVGNATSSNFTADLPTSADQVAIRSGNHSIFTDLNAPVVDGGNQTVFPIADPAALGSVEGFTVSNNSSLGTVTGNSTQPRLLMPARWLYMLKDGTLAAATATANTSTATVSGASASNPIVGRVAFWTDDETSKVNINTSSEGTFWDVPHVNSTTERGFASSQPAQKEFQRYPGHPAMTSLAPVFFATSNTTTGNLTQDQRNALYSVAPRIVGGGSNSGSSFANSTLTPDSDRLYASVDELMFTANRTSQDANASITAEKVRQRSFFLTASSRAPEVTMFNTPRIAIWPIYRGLSANNTTAYDKLIAFCSTINGSPYYFQREKPLSTTNDINIARNIELYNYLRTLTGKAVPGFGGNFLSKYSADRDQILTQIFDYIRSANLKDDNITLAANRFSTTGFVAPTRYTTAGGTDTMGFGRFYTVTEAALGFICNAVADDPATTGTDESSGSNITVSSNATLGNKVLGGTPLAAGEKYIQAIFVPEFFSPMFGWSELSDGKFRMRVTGLENLTVTVGGATQNLFPASVSATATDTINKETIFWGKRTTGSPGPAYFAVGKGSPARGSLPADYTTADAVYPYIGTPIKITAPVTGGTMAFTGGNITIELYANNTALPAPGPDRDARLMQKIEIQIPNGTFPVPNLVSTGTTIENTGAAGYTPSYQQVTTKENWWAFSSNGTVSGKNGRLNFIKDCARNNASREVSGDFFRTGNSTTGPFDVVRSVMPRHGDFRLIAASSNFTSSGTFVAHPSYGVDTTFLAHTLPGSRGGSQWPGRNNNGRYLSTVTSGVWNNAADIPSGAAAADRPEATGDFDTGFSTYTDGPYINKPDEGMAPLVAGEIPYFVSDAYRAAPGPTFFTPNRIMRSAGMFGSLPTGVKAGVPWRTLLFRPQPSHPSHSSTIADHLLLDLFWMPVVEPYAISEPFSTAGKINMNYAIAPFDYISRKTGMAAVLRAEKLFAIPNNAAALNDCKTYGPSAPPWTGDARREIDENQTLKQFDALFAGGEIYKSASQICDIHLIPTGTTITQSGNTTNADAVMTTGDTAFWNSSNNIAGDNMRERPYANLLGRLTTKSNSFTVHFRVQVLKKNPTTQANEWVEGRDSVSSEYRGSTLIERYIDPNNTSLPDFATTTSANIDDFYRFRVIQTRK
ncbi:MAG: Verru_Chthon cassette protein A, partial [Verrucomicrobiota bacterium]